LTLLEAVTSGTAYIIMALFIGTLAAASFVLPKGEDALRRSLLSSAPILLLTFLAVVLLSLFLQGAKLAGVSVPTLDILSRYLLRTQSGKIWLIRELYGVFLALLILGLRKNADPARAASLLFFCSLPLVAGRSLMSHAVAVKENTALIVMADALHAVATGLWAGGLLVLVWVLWRGMKRLGMPLAWAAQTVARFSRLALLSVTLLVLTGAYQSVIHVQSFAALFGTPYGQLLLVKISLFLAMVSFGALNFLSTRPGLFRMAGSTGDDGNLPTKVLTRIGVESLLGFAVLCVTGFLTILPPGAHSAHLVARQRSAPVSPNVPMDQSRKNGPSTDFLTRLQSMLMPSLMGLQTAEGAKITILSPGEGESFKGDEVPMKYAFVKGRRGHHLHAYIDGVLMGMFSDPERGVLTGIQPGRHTLELRVVAEDHVTELDATASVRFVVN
jgi:putative copper export protein